MIARATVFALTLAASGAPAFAQSYTAPAGIPAVTAPGGLVGRSAPRFIEPTSGSARAIAPLADDGLSTGSVRRTRDGQARYAR